MPSTQKTDQATVTIEIAMKSRSTVPRPMLINLPIELRQHIYSYIFHPNGCKAGKACHCGDGISTTNRQLYREVRALVYQYAKPRFFDVESCIRFLRDIRHHVVNISSLSIVERDATPQSYRLADVFKQKGLECLQSFELKVIPDVRLNRPLDRPLYLSFARPIALPAAVYDMSLRVCRHPLAAMKHLRRLRVIGSPQSDIEEAIFKASNNIQDLARSETKSVESHATLSNREGGILGWWLWNYSIEIVD